MKNVINSFIFILVVFNSCNIASKKNNFNNHNCKNYYFDIIGNTEIDTLKMCYKNNNMEIILPKNTVIKVLPRINPDYLKQSPPIENIYIEPNNIQTNEKGVRISIRNTDLIPDYIFMDLIYKKKNWYVKQFGIINTNSKKLPYIMIKNINKPIAFELYNGKIFNPKYIFIKYFTSSLINQSK